MIAQRIADSVGVRRIGRPFDITEAASRVLTFAEGPVMVWYQEVYRKLGTSRPGPARRSTGR